jgi:hypothetical protein
VCLQLKVNTTTIRALVETATNKAHKRGLVTTEQKTAIHNINGHSGEIARDYYVLEEVGEDTIHANAAFGAMKRANASTHLTRINGDGGGGGGGDSDSDSDWGDSGGGGSEVPDLALTGGEFLVPLPAPLPIPVPVLAFPPAADLDFANFLLAKWDKSNNQVPVNWGSGRADYGKQVTRAAWTNQEVLYIGKWIDASIIDNPHNKNVVAACLEHLHSDPAAVPVFHSLHVLDSGRLRNGYRKWPSLKAKLIAAQQQCD